ncbi:hypothetical protein SAMN05443572_104427 [Myxococcus fulvus]|uniref:Uncharacterized protein n=2 Tax=Myxococcus fulvus TaxID=33 RepID=A0ABY1CG76_MYXFU|nr:hypothetical protein [Myxococcus fulvus]AKF83872.1 hypothetical protein MFUL124B02_38540 [Myxococcus fulvus 124B02]SEU02458.1 hypothetical protein SAMN05443572_104427 [Myxococcus fulvus]
MDPVEGVVMVLVVAMTCGIPLLGLTLRFSLKPVLEAFIRLREAQLGSHPENALLRERVAYLERVLEAHGLIEDRRVVHPTSPAERLPPGATALKDRERV